MNDLQEWITVPYGKDNNLRNIQIRLESQSDPSSYNFVVNDTALHNEPKTVGNISYEILTEANQSHIHIQWMEIDPEYQGKKYSKLLIQLMVKLSPNNKVTLTPLDDSPLTHFKNGFRSEDKDALFRLQYCADHKRTLPESSNDLHSRMSLAPEIGQEYLRLDFNACQPFQSNRAGYINEIGSLKMDFPKEEERFALEDSIYELVTGHMAKGLLEEKLFEKQFYEETLAELIKEKLNLNNNEEVLAVIGKEEDSFRRYLLKTYVRKCCTEQKQAHSLSSLTTYGPSAGGSEASTSMVLQSVKCQSPDISSEIPATSFDQPGQGKSKRLPLIEDSNLEGQATTTIQGMVADSPVWSGSQNANDVRNAWRAVTPDIIQKGGSLPNTRPIGYVGEDAANGFEKAVILCQETTGPATRAKPVPSVARHIYVVSVNRLNKKTQDQLDEAINEGRTLKNVSVASLNKRTIIR